MTAVCFHETRRTRVNVWRSQMWPRTSEWGMGTC